MPIFVIVIMVFLTAAQDGGRRAVEANQAYEQGDYQRAEQLYRNILEDQPDRHRVLFNLGNALARQGDTEASLEVFQRYRELTDDPGERASAEYNLGYLHGNAGNTEEAIYHFRQALELDPADDDASFNYELLKRRMQEKEDDNQQDQPQSGQPPPTSDDGDSGQSERSPADNQPQSGEERSDGLPEPTEDQLKHAEDLMNALEQLEKDLIKDFKKRQMDPIEPHEKDW